MESAEVHAFHLFSLDATSAVLSVLFQKVFLEPTIHHRAIGGNLNSPERTQASAMPSIYDN